MNGQVINEFCNTCIKKNKLSTLQLKRIIGNVYDLFELYVLNDNTVIHALSLHERYGYSYYDSLIIAAAIEGECEYLFSEDLQDGQTIEGVTIQNIYTNL